MNLINMDLTVWKLWKWIWSDKYVYFFFNEFRW